MNKFEITFLGTGTSTGSPIVGCDCKVCISKDPRDNRLRTSLHVKFNGLEFIIDTGPDLRTQLLRENIRRCDFAIITHDHSDHLHGIDDLRPFTFLPKRKTLPVFCHQTHLEKIKNRFDYIFKRDEIFNSKNPYLGGGLPLLNLHDISTINDQFPKLDIQTALIPHGTGKTTGLIFQDKFAYFIDCHEIPEDAVQKLRDLNLKCLIIDCLQPADHPSHLTIEKSFKYLEMIRPERGILIHMNHDILHTKLEKMATQRFSYPVTPAYDGLKIQV